MEPIIHVRNLTKIYKTQDTRVRAVNDVTLEIMPGQSYAIVGTSGSGKSTLLGLIAGLERPTAGKIMIGSRSVHAMSESQLVDFRLRNIGFVFQSYNLFETMTAEENAAFVLAAKGVPRQKRLEMARSMLENMGLGRHLKHKPSQLSGGQQQRVAIARALISSPKILFADEPTGNLDSHTAQEIMELLRMTVRFEKTTLLFVTHDIQNAQFADSVIHISDGRIVEDAH
ncbi:MAG: ABC transporter ATP-binding protein [Eubacteriales bacterium]|nr:ABC transporter ATP-binding protein [Eubacteriales bacterium]